MEDKRFIDLDQLKRKNAQQDYIDACIEFGKKNEDNAIKAFDLTPTWSALIPFLLQIARDTSDKDVLKELATEFGKMAKAADAYNASKKQLEIIGNKISKLSDQYNVSSGLGNELSHVVNMINSI